MKILLAVDGSPHTIKAVEFIAAHPDWFPKERELHLLYVAPAVPLGHLRPIIGPAELNAYYGNEAGAAMLQAEQLLAASGISFISSHKVGDAGHEIQAYATENGVDMIVMGSHGHSAFKNLVMGSVATKVLALTSVPVLIIR